MFNRATPAAFPRAAAFVGAQALTYGNGGQGAGRVAPYRPLPNGKGRNIAGRSLRATLTAAGLAPFHVQLGLESASARLRAGKPFAWPAS